jgi:hypothetical protein
MPPKAITSSVAFMALDDGVDGLKEAVAIRGAPLPCSACFSNSHDVVVISSKLMHPSSLWLE